MIVPSFVPQSVGFVEDTFVIAGADGDDNTIGLFAQGVKQEPSVFLTTTMYDPSDKLENVLLLDQESPPSIENSMLPTKVAPMDI